jgi:tetratricopeptide (TPR) repeat protein
MVSSLLADGCTTQGPIQQSHIFAEKASSELELQNVPFFPQKAYQCGPAALATVLAASGIEVTPDELEPKIYLPQRRGSLQLELLAASRRYERLPYVIDAELPALLAELEAGHPVLVLQNLGWKHYPVWHYAVVVSANPSYETIILRSGMTKRKTLKVSAFLKSWNRAGSWGLVVLKPGELPARPSEHKYVRAAASLEAVGRNESALAAYLTASTRWPNNEFAMLGLGNTHYALGDLNRAEADYRHLLDQYPDHKAARNNLAQVLAERGCYKMALREIEVALLAEEDDTDFSKTLSDTRVGILKMISRAGGQENTCQAGTYRAAI